MSSIDEEIQEPFKLNVQAVQGKWLCEELGVSLRVDGQTIQYASGECYPLEVTPEGKLEVFGYRGVEKKSDASSITWKHKETGHCLTWMYEGDDADVEPEVDARLIIQGSDGRTTRKRKVDYVALDKELDENGQAINRFNGGNINHVEHKNNAKVSPGPSEEAITTEFNHLKRKFNKWLVNTRTDRCREILAKRGYLSTEVDFIQSPAISAAANRLANYLKCIGVKASLGQGANSLQIRVPDSVWEKLILSAEEEAGVAKPPSNLVLHKVSEVRDKIVRFCEQESKSASDIAEIENVLDTLESLPIDLNVLKDTRIGVEINKLCKFCDKAKVTLTKLKSIYLDSKK